MRRILITMSIAAALFASCEQDDEKLAPFRDDKTIKFGKVETRAEVSSANDILEFGVFAEMNLGADGTEDTIKYINLLSNECVYRANASSDWSYDNKRYWVNDRTFHFFAVYPYMQGQVSAATLTQNGEQYDGYKVDFETPSNANTDLMTAFKTEKTMISQTEYPTINFQFGHALSKITFKVAKNPSNSSQKIVVRNISLTNIKKNGIYSSSRNGNYIPNWEVNDDVMNINQYNLNKELDTNGTIVATFLLIPQEIIENTIKLSVNYAYYGIDGVYAYENTATANIPITDNIDKWDIASSYTYKITLAAEENNILFGTPSVDVDGIWDEENEKLVGGTIIIQ